MFKRCGCPFILVWETSHHKDTRLPKPCNMALSMKRRGDGAGLGTILVVVFSFQKYLCIIELVVKINLAMGIVSEKGFSLHMFNFLCNYCSEKFSQPLTTHSNKNERNVRRYLCIFISNTIPPTNTKDKNIKTGDCCCCCYSLWFPFCHTNVIPSVQLNIFSVEERWGNIYFIGI